MGTHLAAKGATNPNRWVHQASKVRSSALSVGAWKETNKVHVPRYLAVARRTLGSAVTSCMELAWTAAGRALPPLVQRFLNHKAHPKEPASSAGENNIVFSAPCNKH